MTAAMDQKKVKRYGKLFGTIDFTLSDHLNPDIINKRYTDTTIGSFHIGGKEFEITLAELDRIVETAEVAKSSFLKSYSMGRFGR